MTRATIFVLAYLAVLFGLGMAVLTQSAAPVGWGLLAVVLAFTVRRTA
jgi:hypothetical protein